VATNQQHPATYSGVCHPQKRFVTTIVISAACGFAQTNSPNQAYNYSASIDHQTGSKELFGAHTGKDRSGGNVIRAGAEEEGSTSAKARPRQN